VAAVHTPFRADGTMRLDAVEIQAAHLARSGVALAFVGGTTGEFASLSLEERRALGRRWLEVAPGHGLGVVVHVGASALADARTLAADAEAYGALAIAAIAPSYFKPADLDALVACSAEAAAAAPGTPFYYYDVPSLTGVSFSMPDYLEAARGRVPTLAALGARGAVGSTYNFAAPVARRLLRAFESGDLHAAREEQLRLARLVRLLAGFGYLGAAKATMALVGVDVGPPRLPSRGLAPDRVGALREGLARLGFFEWIADGR
jgi:N-acetylneuraminate lyase